MAPAPVRWGICGTGRMAATIAAELRGLRAAGARAARGGLAQPCAPPQAFAQRFGIPRAHGSYADLARDPQVDVVYIATPPALHAENALACIAPRQGGPVREAVRAERLRGDGDGARGARPARVPHGGDVDAGSCPPWPPCAAIVAAGTLGKLRLVTGGGGFIPAL